MWSVKEMAQIELEILKSVIESRVILSFLEKEDYKNSKDLADAIITLSDELFNKFKNGWKEENFIVDTRTKINGLQEGKIKKGGINKKPTSLPPSLPPKGQGKK